MIIKSMMKEKYRLDGIYRTINNVFAQVGLLRMEAISGSLVYRDNGHSKDYGRFGRIVNAIKRQAWFMENVSE